jgi:tRNA(adenine34) deaminase
MHSSPSLPASHPASASETDCANWPGPTEQALQARDELYLRHAIALAAKARQRGNRPFGALIVSAEGEILAEGHNSNGETGDCTAHAEILALRVASPLHSREELAQATLYASGEPCVMCAGAICWSNIRRVVFGIDAERLRQFRGQHLDQRDTELSCRQVFAAAPMTIACLGPALLNEAAWPHAGAWKS